MASYAGELVCRWVPEPGQNHQGPVYKGYAGEFSDVTGQPDANIIPEPNAYVCAFVVDEKTAEQLQADPDFVVLWIDAVRTDEVAGPGDVVRAPELDELLTPEQQSKFQDILENDAYLRAIREELGGQPAPQHEPAPAIGPDAVAALPKDAIPPANERAALTPRLVAMGLRGVDLAAIITAQNARGVAAGKLKELCKNFPKAKV